jgi:oxygen-independent coproporphyrinogen-3 oxidase
VVPAVYLDRLLAEAASLAGAGRLAPALDSLYIGGGTPSLLTPPQVDRLLRGIRGIVPLAAGAEVTLEANPEDITPALLDAWAASGVNRLSIGIQSLNDGVLAAVHRRARRDTVLRGLGLVAKHWGGTLSLDLIAGLPGETASSFREGLDVVLGFAPPHLSLYGLVLGEGSPLSRRLSPRERAALEERGDRLWEEGREHIEKAGLRHYEVSNFAAPGFECRHNLAYWECRSYGALGAGATATYYRTDGTAERRTASQLPEPESREAGSAGDVIMEEIDEETARFEYLMLGFRLLRGISPAAYQARFGSALPCHVEETFARWERRGLAQRVGERLALNEGGLRWLSAFLRELLTNEQ